jgi:hypothetical protein
MIRFIGASLQLQPIITAHAQWLLQSLLDYECLPVYCGEWRTKSHCSSWMRFPSRCLTNGFSGFLSRKRVLASRCLAMDYSGFQASYHNINLFSYIYIYCCSMCFIALQIGGLYTHGVNTVTRRIHFSGNVSPSRIWQIFEVLNNISCNLKLSTLFLVLHHPHYKRDNVLCVPIYFLGFSTVLYEYAFIMSACYWLLAYGILSDKGKNRIKILDTRKLNL